MILNANGPTLVVADEVDETGAIDFELRNDSVALVYGALTLNQAETLARHLLKLVEGKRGIQVGDEVRIIETAWDDLRWQVGTVTHKMNSGNLQVLVDNTALVVHPNSVEVIK